MGSDAKDKERDSPYSVCGGCCLGTTLLLVLILLLLSLFGGLSSPDETGKAPMMGSPWIIADCKDSGGRTVDYVATPWEICYSRPAAMSSGFDADIFEYISDLGGSSNTRVCQEWVNIDESNSWDVLVQGFKSAASSACFALACIFLIATLLCLVIHSDIKNKCLILILSILIILALLLSFVSLLLTVGDANLMDSAKWEDESLCSTDTTVSIGNGASAWAIVCVVFFLFALVFCSPLACGCGVCVLCASGGEGGGAAGAAGGAEEAGKGCVSKVDGCVVYVVKKVAVVVEKVYVGVKACVGKLLVCGLPFLCFPCFLLDKATKGNDMPSPCMVNIATSCILTVVLNVCLGTFWGYPSPYPKNDAIGNPWVIATCKNSPTTRVLTLFEACRAPAAGSVTCFDWEDSSTGGMGSSKFRTVMYEELNPLVMLIMLLCVVVVALLMLQRICVKKSDMCSPLGFILSLATVGGMIGVLAMSAITTLYASDAMDVAVWASAGCIEPSIAPGGGAIVFMVVICVAAIGCAIFMWPILAGLAACACCCAACICGCCHSKDDKEEKGKRVVI